MLLVYGTAQRSLTLNDNGIDATTDNRCTSAVCDTAAMIDLHSSSHSYAPAPNLSECSRSNSSYSQC